MIWIIKLIWSLQNKLLLNTYEGQEKLFWTFFYFNCYIYYDENACLLLFTGFINRRPMNSQPPIRQSAVCMLDVTLFLELSFT